MFNAINDITSVEKLGTSLYSQVAKVKKSRRPLVITEEGEPAVVMLAADEYQRLVEMAEAQAMMALAEERSSDVMELEEAIDYVYRHLSLPRRAMKLRGRRSVESRTHQVRKQTPHPLHYSTPRIVPGKTGEPKRRLLVKDLGWTKEQALANHYRYRSFAEDWNAPGMEVYDQL